MLTVAIGNGQWQQRVRRVTYSLDEGAILGGAVGDGEGGAVGRVRLRTLDELAGAKGIVGGAFFSRHDYALVAGARVKCDVSSIRVLLGNFGHAPRMRT
jgi:hypothetical protein